MDDLDDDAADGVTVREVLDKEISELRQALYRCRREALEEAETLVRNWRVTGHHVLEIAAAIRALKEKE